MSVPVEGQFKRFDAQVALDPRHVEKGQVTLSIDTASATFGIAETDQELAKPEWFAPAQHPKATFKSSAMQSV